MKLVYNEAYKLNHHIMPNKRNVLLFTGHGQTSAVENLQKFNLTAAEQSSVIDWVLEGAELPLEIEEKIFNFYIGSGEMPYGVAKARDGDPLNWMLNKLRETL